MLEVFVESFVKAGIVSLIIVAIWHGLEWMQFGKLQWNRQCDEVVGLLYFVVMLLLFAHQ